jgi:hypothetical protein
LHFYFTVQIKQLVYFQSKGLLSDLKNQHSQIINSQVHLTLLVKSFKKLLASQSGGNELDHPPLMTPVQSQAETVFSFSEILFHM